MIGHCVRNWLAKLLSVKASGYGCAGEDKTTVEIDVMAAFSLNGLRLQRTLHTAPLHARGFDENSMSHRSHP